MSDGVPWDEAVARVTGGDGRFAVTEVEVDGRRERVFARTPPSLRDFFAAGRRRGDAELCVYEDERWTYDALLDHAGALGHLLVERYRVAPGDRVAIAMRNYPEWISAFVAATSVGAIAVALNAWWTSEELAYGLRDCGARVVLADAERVERIAPLLARDDTPDAAVLAVRAPGPLPPGVEHLADVLEPGRPMPEVTIAPDDDATILYTSGTTGEPKGAVSTQRAVLSALMAFGCRAAINALVQPPEREHPWPTCYILVVPLFHVTGLVPVMLGSFASNAKLVMLYKWDPSRALELVERERVTAFVGVPTMSWDLLEAPDFDRYDTSSLISVGGGGAPAPPELVRRIDANFRHGRPQMGYGMTETNAYGPGNAGADYLRKPTSAGRVVPIVDVAVVDPDGRPLPPGERGEICFRGPNLIRGYWNKPDATAEAIVDGWLRSGDIGRVDEEGFVYVEDRAKDIVIRGGENIYCAEVEAVVYELPGVHEAAVFGVPHERLGEELAVAVLPKVGHTLDPDALRAHVGEHLASFKVPSRVLVVDDPLPRNASGKILKRELRDRLVGN